MKQYIEFIDDAKTSAVEQLNIFLENLSKGSIHKVAGYQANTDCTYILLEVENELANQLDEPKPVKVPQFVDDVTESAREHSPELEDALHYACSNGSQEFTEWYQKKSNRDLFARAWLDGYEVKKEKRYTVKLTITKQYLYRRDNDFTFVTHTRPDDNPTLFHTRKQLEDADFGWVFDCPGIEIEEVE